MDETTECKSYLIELCLGGTYDIMKDGMLVECNFKTVDEAKAYIDAA